MLQKMVINKIVDLLAKQFKLYDIMKYVKEPNDADERIDKLEAELEIASVVRKSIHIKTDLNKGTVISEEMLIMQRPGTGISPMEIDYIVGKTIVKDKKRHDILVYSDFK